MAIVLSFVFISCGDDMDEPATPDGHKYVDLGLPSRTLWATCNIGAKSPEEFGDYFAWGETEPKEVYEWSTYKWYKRDYDFNEDRGVTKYCDRVESGYHRFVDRKIQLDPEDDAAYANWGPNWRMPTMEQMMELINSCTWQWTQRNGVNGQLVTGPNGNTLFLPAAGYHVHDEFHQAGSEGDYWSRTLEPSESLHAFSIFVDTCGLNYEPGIDMRRCSGLTVRAVRLSQN